jgi:Fe-S-cluster-containing dehydrogenase component/DMSO reductase anchor subunit
MRKGFIFSYELCVGCKACSAACMLENGWSFRSRNIYSVNGGCFKSGPVINLSMACNHCDDPACLKGCPSGAFIKDSTSGTILIDPDKCLGCRYCIWNCPYDAPKLNTSSGIIEKCHFCHHRLAEGIEPACSSSCPTGALSFGEIEETIDLHKYSWMPEKNLNPSLQITGNNKYDGPVIIPERAVSVHSRPEMKNDKENRDWSLVVFTFLVILSVSFSVAGPFMERSINGSVEIALAFFAALFSLFHLGRWWKAWRAISNLKSSPLSREITLFMIYSILIVLKNIIIIPYSEIVTIIAGISLVLTIDSVYYFSSGRKNFRFHSGQAFLSVMQMISFLLSAVVPFIFVGFVRAALSAGKIMNEERKEMFVLRFIRIASLVIAAMVLVRGNSYRTYTSFLIYYSGELADRIIFYADFKPININDTLANDTLKNNTLTF